MLAFLWSSFSRLVTALMLNSVFRKKNVEQNKPSCAECMFVCDSQLRLLREDVLLNWEEGAAEGIETKVRFTRFDGT